MITFSQTTGHITSEDGVLLDTGYAGNGVGKNNPAAQAEHNVGPIPRGMYTMQPPVNTDTHGPYVIWLTPDADNEMFGRAAFGMHSDRRVGPAGLASEGCIVCLLIKRQDIWNGGHRRLKVV